MAWGQGDSHSEDKYQQSGEWNPIFEVFWLVHFHQNRILVGVRPNKGASTPPVGKVCMGSSFSVTEVCLEPRRIFQLGLGNTMTAGGFKIIQI